MAKSYVLRKGMASLSVLGLHGRFVAGTVYVSTSDEQDAMVESMGDESGEYFKTHREKDDDLPRVSFSSMLGEDDDLPSESATEEEGEDITKKATRTTFRRNSQDPAPKAGEIVKV